MEKVIVDGLYPAKALIEYTLKRKLSDEERDAIDLICEGEELLMDHIKIYHLPDTISTFQISDNEELINV